MTIFSLKKGDTIIQGDDALLDHATSFYKDLFGPVADTAIRLNNEIWEEGDKLNNFDRLDMDWRFSMEEIKEVIDQMERNKAASLDGISIEFYQTCWDIVKQDVMAVFDDLFEHKIDLDKINYGIITLIPKSVDSDVIQKF
jgi:hypothetical protein